MSGDDIIRYTSQAMIVCLLLSLPAIVSSALIGLGVAFFQAVTNLQDASIGHGIKLFVVAATLALTAPWTGSQLLNFALSLWQAAFRS